MSGTMGHRLLTFSSSLSYRPHLRQIDPQAFERLAFKNVVLGQILRLAIS